MNKNNVVGLLNKRYELANTDYQAALECAEYLPKETVALLKSKRDEISLAINYVNMIEV